MRERLFTTYLNLNRHYAVTEQLYRKKQITRADLKAVKDRISEIEMELIMPKQKSSHPRKLTVIE